MAGPEPRHPGEVLSALSDDVRLAVFAALVLGGPTSAAGVAEQAGTDPRATVRGLDRLARSGLVEVDDGGSWRALPATLAASARAATRLAVDPDAGDGAPTPEAAAVLRAYVAGGRLRSVPAVRHKRLVILDWLSQRFEPGKVYPEAEVNRIIDRYHPDHASLRRHLVDEDLMTRRDGMYWRSGGTYEVG